MATIDNTTAKPESEATVKDILARVDKEDISFIRAESVGREPLDEASAFHAADGCAPTVVSESCRETSA